MSLAQLDAPDANPAVFAGQSRFALDNVAALTGRPNQIEQIRQTILNLAVRGLLVPQRPSEENASAQLTVSDGVRRRVAAEDRRADPESLALLAAEEIWGVPVSWEWRALADLASAVH